MQNSAFSAGCSAMSWQSENGLHFWGRNFDFNRIDGGSAVLYLPRGEDICAYLSPDGQGRRSVSAKYACLGEACQRWQNSSSSPVTAPRSFALLGMVR